MKSIISYIFAVLLCLPVHTLSYVKTVLHVAQHVHEHDEDIDHEASSESPGTAPDLSHRHTPDQPVHSHDMDIWGLLSHSGLSQQAKIVCDAPASQTFELPFFDIDPFMPESFSGSLLRPPIA
jgi:hypothetical protein